MNSLPLRLLCLLTAKGRHIPAVLKELLAVPKLAESHSYLLIGSLWGQLKTEGAPAAESSVPGTVCCWQWSAGQRACVCVCLHVFVCVCVPFYVKGKHKVVALKLTVRFSRAFYSVLTSCCSLTLSSDVPERNWQAVVGFVCWSNIPCSKSAARTKCAAQTLSFPFPEQITHRCCFVKWNAVQRGREIGIRQNKTNMQIKDFIARRNFKIAAPIYVVNKCPVVPTDPSWKCIVEIPLLNTKFGTEWGCFRSSM